MGNMNWKFLIFCLLVLSFSIEANCLRGTGHMWQPRPPAGGITSCNPPSLLPSDDATATATAGAPARIATTPIEIVPAPREVVTAPPAAVMLANYVYQCASRQARMASSCSQQPPKPQPEPESKPESHPALVWGQEQHEPEPEVPKPRTVTLVASELEVTRPTD